MVTSPDDALMKRVEELCEAAQHVSAWSLLEGLSPPEQWTVPKWQIRASKILDHVGGAKRSRRLVLRLWRAKKSRQAAREQMFWEVLGMRGALRAWQWLKANPPAEDSSERVKILHLGYRAYALGELRDFERASGDLDEALRHKPEDPWLHTIKSHLLARQDRHAEALNAAETAMRLDSSFISSVHATEEALLALGRDEDALTMLRNAVSRMESNSLAAALVNLELELELYDEAAKTLDRYESLLPIKEEDSCNWLHARRCDLACHLGDYETARAWAEKVTDSGFYRSIAQRLSGIRAGLKRISLPVSFVRQHHQTCVPASLTMICRYWKRPVEHITLAEEICHDGTPIHSERRWADEHGFATCEFTVTVDAAKQLVAAGIPFTLTSVYPGGAHCVIVTGFDEFRHVLLIRDPDHRSRSEFLAEEGLKSLAFCGPRGMAMVPLDRATELASMCLPEAELHDALHTVNLALASHERDTALAQVRKLSSLAPDHRLTWHAKWALAAYDGDPAAGLEAVEALCRLHPENVNWQMDRISRMTGVRSTEERLAELRKLCEAKDSDPLLWRMLARELHADERQLPETRRWLTKLLRQRKDALGWLTSANLLWSSGQREEATELYRLASCWDDKDEQLASTYFRAARWTKQADTALAFLRSRAQRMARTSAVPSRTLHNALNELDRWEEALAVMEESLRDRPDDADQMLFAARVLANFGKSERATELLQMAKSKGRPSEWRRVSAEMLRRRCLPEEALKEWEKVLEDEPLAMDAHRSVAVLHERLEGAQGALRYVRMRCEQWPHHWPLHELLLEWSREESPAAWEEASHKLVTLQPHNAWARRELALALESLKKFPEAHVHLDAAEAIEPRSGAQHYVRASVLKSEGRHSEAYTLLHHAVEIDVDHTVALQEFVKLARTPEHRIEALRFVQEQIVRQTTNGDSVTSFAECARPYLPSPSLQQFLEEAHGERPDLWQTWTTLAAHWRDHERVDDAVSLLERAAERFPLMPRIWLELGAAHAAKPDRTRQIEALEKVRDLNPAWGAGMRMLAEALDFAGRFADALATMEQAVRSSPLDAFNHGGLAERKWATGQREDALHHVVEAVRLDPGYSWAWEALMDWSNTLMKPGLASAALDRLIAQRPMEPRTWLRVADSLSKREEFDQKLAALDKAIALSPYGFAGRDEKARVLGLVGRFSEALALCRDSADSRPPFPELGVREAWLLAQKGDLERAIGTMDEALARDSANAWGWQLLSGWHEERKDYARAEEAVRHIARLRPNDPVPHGFMADLRLKRDDRAGAIAALKRSIELQPGYRFGGLTLFRLYLEDRRFDDAAAVLDSIRGHIGHLNACARDFVLGSRRLTADSAFAALKAMLECQEDEPSAFELITEELKQRPAPLLERASDMCVEHFASPDCNRETGAFYVRLCAQVGSQPQEKHLRILPTDGVAVQRAYREWFSTLGAKGWEHVAHDHTFRLWLYRWRVLRLIRRHGPWLRQHSELWGIAGYATHTLRLSRATVRWLGDWRDQPNAPSWALNNLFIALQHRGDRQEAIALVRHALTLPEHNSITIRFRLWAAVEAALSGEPAEARQLLDGVDSRGFESYDTALHAFLVVLMQFLPDVEHPPSKLSASAKASLTGLLGKHDRTRLGAQDFGRAYKLISRRIRSPWLLIWGWKHQHPNMFAMAIFVAFIVLLLVINFSSL